MARLIGERNESQVEVNGQGMKALIDTGAQVSSISLAMVKRMKLRIHQLQTLLDIEGTGGTEVPYLGYVEVHLCIPEVQKFDLDVLMLVVPDSQYTENVPIALGTLHIDMLLELATERELAKFNE